VNWKTEPSIFNPEDKRRCTVSAPGKMANNYESDNAIEFECGPNLNGSGPEHFGGAREWPVLKLKVAFQSHETEKRDRLLKHLQLALEVFFEQEKLRHIFLSAADKAPDFE
jgi:hypothetical protein